MMPMKGLTLIIAGVLAIPASAAAPIRLVYQGQTVTTSAPVVRSSTGTLVPLRATAQTLGGHVTWDGTKKAAMVTHEGRRLEVDPRSSTAWLDGHLLTRFTVPRTAGNHVLAPMMAMERLFSVHGQWLPEQRLLRFASSPGGGGQTPQAGAGGGVEVEAGDVRLRLTTDRRSYAMGTPVALTLTVWTLNRAGATLEFSSGQKYDFEIRRAGQVIWRWSADRMFTQALTSLTLKPEERKPFTEVWRQQDNAGKPVPAGTYEVVAVLTTMERPQPRTGTLTIRLGG